jgi:uncharacterized protein
VSRRPTPSALAFPLAGLLGEPPGVSRTFTFEGVVLDVGDDLELVDGVSGRLLVTRTNRGLYAAATVQGELRESCSRCLREVAVPVGVTIEEEALPSIDIATGLRNDPSAEPEIVRLSDAHELDLGPLVRDAISLAEPIAPLCRPDCPGLCPECGADLATGSHDHGEAPVDPRLAVLGGFRVDGERDTD